MTLDRKMVGRLAAVVMLIGSLGNRAGAAADASASPAEPKSPAAREAKQAYDAAVARAEADLVAARKAYADRLDAALKASMAAGDLDEANRIDALRKAAVAPAAVPAVAIAGAADAGGANAPAGSRRPGWIVGNVADAAGKPIRGAELEVAVFGTTLQGGQRAEFRMEVDPAGHFEQELPDGLYAVTAYVVKEFEGSRFRLPLHPNDDKPDRTKLPSKAGIVKDFTWRMTGVRPGYDPKQPFAYYGPMLRIYDARYLGEDTKKLSAKFGKGANVVVTMTPRGATIDGARAEPLTVTAPLAEIGTTIGHKRLDVPLAAYRLTAKIVTADGKEHPAGVGTKFQGENAAAVNAVFAQAGPYDSIREITLYVGD